MSGLWSRACRPRATANIIARWSSSAPQKRRLRIGDVFTACYSAVFASAAIVDCKRKHDRRVQWDEAIAEVRSEIADDIVYTHGQPDYRPRTPQRNVHLERSEDMVKRLVSGLLWQARRDRLRATRQADSVTKEELFETFRAGFAGLPKYSLEGQESPEGAIEIVLDTSTRENGWMEAAVVGVCESLFVSATAPTVTTYKLLIERFTSLRQHRLAEVVVRSFYDDSRLRPCANMVASILRHYIAMNNGQGFYDTVRRMQGEAGGIRLAQRGIWDLERQHVAAWVNDGKVRRVGRMLHEKAYRNGHVYDALILGNLHFGHAQRAFVAFKAAVAQGVDVSAGVVRQLVEGATGRLARQLLAVLMSGDVKMDVDGLRGTVEKWGVLCLRSMEAGSRIA